MRPFCHLVIKGVRVDSPPLTHNGRSFAESLIKLMSQREITQRELADKLGVSLKTLQNWERSRTTSSRRFWPMIRSMLKELSAPATTAPTQINSA